MAKHYQPFFWGDYLRDTGNLSLVEHGAYLRLIGEYWNTGKPLPADAERMRRACGCHSEADTKAIEYVLDRFFSREGDVWRHKRLDADLASEIEHRKKRSEAAKTAAEARWSDASSMRGASQPHATHSTPLQPTPRDIKTPEGEWGSFEKWKWGIQHSPYALRTGPRQCPQRR